MALNIEKSKTESGTPGSSEKEQCHIKDEPKTIESLYEMIGSMGVYQCVSFFLIGIIPVFSAESININFVGGSQEHWCRVQRLENFTHEEQKYISIPKNSDGKYESCKVFQLNFSSYSDHELLSWNRSLMVSEELTPTTRCDQGWNYDRSQYLNTITSRLDLVCHDSWKVPLVSTSFIAGIMIGAVSSGYFSDKYGRKKTLYGSILLKLAATIATSIPLNYPWVLITRFLGGIGNMACYTTGFVIVMEQVGHRWRSILGIAYNMYFSFGFMMWPAMAYFIRDDMKLQLAGAIPLFSLLTFWWLIDESPRWLLVMKRYDEANQVIRKIAIINRTHIPDDFDVSNYIVHDDEDTENSKTCLDLLRSPKLRIRTLIVDLHWFTDSLMYYALSLNTESLVGNIYINTAIMGAVEIPANLAAIFFLNWRLMGRRLTCSLALIVAAVASFVSIYMILEELGTAYTIFTIVAKTFVTMGFNGIYLYTSELFPTEVRHIGIGTASMCGRISGMAAPYVGGPLGDVWKPLPPIVFGGLSAVSGFLTLLLPETLGQQLFNTIEEAEAFGRHPKRKLPDNGLLEETRL